MFGCHGTDLFQLFRNYLVFKDYVMPARLPWATGDGDGGVGGGMVEGVV